MGTQLPTCLISMATPTAPATYVLCKPWYDFTPFTEKEAEGQGYEASCLGWYKGKVSSRTAWHQLKFKTIVIGHEDRQRPGDTDHWAQPTSFFTHPHVLADLTLTDPLL